MQKGELSTPVLSKYALLGMYCLIVQKGQPMHYAVCSRYTVCNSHLVQKVSTHTVDLANMGGGDCYL